MDEALLATLIAKDAIRDLAMLYSRGIDRKDVALLRTLFTADATDTHVGYYEGTATGYLDKVAEALPHLRYSGHHICNHLIAVDGDTAEGELYVVEWHAVADGQGGFIEDIEIARFFDRYAREDGRWKIAARYVEFDLRSARPIEVSAEAAHAPDDDPGYRLLTQRLFARGPRA